MSKVIEIRQDPLATFTVNWLHNLTNIKQETFINTQNASRQAKSLKGPAAKKAIRKSPGYFNQILTFESRKWSLVATF